MKEYVDQIIEEPIPLMTGLRKSEETRGDICPSVGKEIGAFLKFLIESNGYHRVLELGTSIGYSALWLGLGVKAEKGNVDTLEASERLYLEAVENIKAAGMDDTVTCHLGRGEDFLAESDALYDMIFIDCATGSYDEIYEKSLMHLADGGLLVVEDVLFAVMGKRKRQRDLMSAFNDKIMKDKRVNKTLITIGDGLILCSKRKEGSK